MSNDHVLQMNQPIAELNYWQFAASMSLTNDINTHEYHAFLFLADVLDKDLARSIARAFVNHRYEQFCQEEKEKYDKNQSDIKSWIGAWFNNLK